MSGRTSRNKGKRGERLVVKLLQPVINSVWTDLDLGDPPILQRNTLQSDRGGYDIVGLDWLAIEVKWQETLAVEKWWQQTLDQCKVGQTPILFYKQSRRVWRVMMPGEVTSPGVKLRMPVEINVDRFLRFFRAKLVAELVEKGPSEDAEEE